MALDEMHYFTLLEVGRKIQGGEISSVELTEAMLARIERLNPALHPYVTILAESALAEAAQADSEVARGEGRATSLSAWADAWRPDCGKGLDGYHRHTHQRRHANP